MTLFLFILPWMAVRGAMTVGNRWLRASLAFMALTMAAWLVWPAGLLVWVLATDSATNLALVRDNPLVQNAGAIPGALIGLVIALAVWRQPAAAARPSPGA